MSFVLGIFLILFYWVDIRIGLILSFLILISLLPRIVNKRNPLSFNTKDKLFFIYLLVTFIPVLNDQMEINLYIKIAVYPWLLSFVFQNIKYSANKIKVIYFSIILSALIISVIMFFQSNPGAFEFNLTYILTKDRAYGFYFLDQHVKVGPTTIASVLLVVLGGILTFKRFSVGYNTLSIILFGFFFVLLVIAGGRISLVSLIILFNLYFLFSSYSKEKKIFIVAAGLVMVFLFFFIVFSFVIKYQSESFFNHLYSILTPKEDSSALTRLFLWGTAINYIEKNPFGFGYYYFFTKFGKTTHNEFLAQAVGGGVIALVIFLMILFVIIKKVIQILQYKNNNDTLVNFISYFTLSIFIIGTMSMFTENISLSSQNIFYPIFWITIGIFFSVAEDKRLA